MNKSDAKKIAWSMAYNILRQNDRIFEKLLDDYSDKDAGKIDDAIDEVLDAMKSKFK